MPCDCGPETRSLWEQVRDLMKHHDETYDQLVHQRQLNTELEDENKALRKALAKNEKGDK